MIPHELLFCCVPTGSNHGTLLLRHNHQNATGGLHFPGLYGAEARWLVEQRDIRGVGIDRPSIDRGLSKDFRSAIFSNERGNTDLRKLHFREAATARFSPDRFSRPDGAGNRRIGKHAGDCTQNQSVEVNANGRNLRDKGQGPRDDCNGRHTAQSRGPQTCGRYLQCASCGVTRFLKQEANFLGILAYQLTEKKLWRPAGQRFSSMESCPVSWQQGSQETVKIAERGSSGQS